MSASDVAVLKRQLTITPKTATLLVKAGYADYTALATVSPEHVSKQFGDVLRLPSKHVYAYKRALRRIVWLGTQENPEDCPKICKDWSDKALRAKGVWCSNFDQLTGREIDVRLRGAASEKIQTAGGRGKLKVENKA
jgi:hypothetical protein